MRVKFRKCVYLFYVTDNVLNERVRQKGINFLQILTK